MGFSRQGHWNSLPFLVPGNLLTQGSNWGLLCCRQIPYQLSYQGSLFSSRHMSIVLRPEMTPFVLMLSPNACVGKGAWCNSLSLEVFLLFMISSSLMSTRCLAKTGMGEHSPAPFQCLLLGSFSIPVALIKSTQNSE